MEKNTNIKNKMNFRKYYANVLKKDLDALDEKRKEVLKKTAIAACILTIISAVIVFFAKDIGALFGVTLLSLAIIGFIMKILSKGFRKEYKDKIIEQIVQQVDENLKYNMDGYISKSEFLNSKIFEHKIDKYSGEDMVYGKIDKTEIKFSEVLAQYITRDSKGRTQTHTLFKGIFFEADFNKEFTSFIQVKPDIAESMFGRFGTTLQKFSTTGSTKQLIKLEDPTFEKYFAVYGPNQVEARYILSPKVMESIVKIKTKFNKNISLSFINSKLYVAIPFKKDLFEPSIIKSISRLDHVEEYYEILQDLVDIVESLDLNTRIWTKE